MVGNEFQKVIRWTLSLEKVRSAAVLWKIIFSLGTVMRHPWRRNWLSLLGGGRELQKSGKETELPSVSFNQKTCWWQLLLEGTEIAFSPAQGSRHCLASVLLRARQQCSTAEWLHTLLCLGSSREGWSMWSVTGSTHPWAPHKHCTEAQLLEHLLDGCLKSTRN